MKILCLKKPIIMASVIVTILAITTPSLHAASYCNTFLTKEDCKGSTTLYVEGPDGKEAYYGCNWEGGGCHKKARKEYTGRVCKKMIGSYGCD